MRVLLQTDMEGISRITDFREILPLWDEYWELGRPYLTDEVVAAAQGLLAGGATEVVVDDQHLGRPANIIAERLPDKASMPGSRIIYQQLQDRAFDAVFQVGRHARWGTNDGFVSHTQMPGISLAIDGALITECHICALRAGVPVLGITGDDRLEPQIDGAIAGTPFLPVKRSRGLTRTRPRRRDATRSLADVQEFASRCARAWSSRPTPTLPESFTLSAFVGVPANATKLARVHGFELVGDAVVSVQCNGWWSGAEPAMQAATGVAAAPIIDALGSLDVSSQTDLKRINPVTLESARERLTSWLAQPQVAWVG